MGLHRVEQRKLQADIAVADRLTDHHAFVVQKFTADTLIHALRRLMSIIQVSGREYMLLWRRHLSS